MSNKIFSSDKIISHRVIYSASPFAKNNLLYLQEIGHTNYLVPYSSNRSTMKSFLFFMVSEGSGELNYQHTSYALKKGDCVFINCSSPYSISSTEDLWALYWLHFDGPNMLEIYEKFIERCGSPCFSINAPDSIATLHQKISETSQENAYVRDMHIMERLVKLLSLIMENCWHKSPSASNSHKHKEMNQIKDYLDDNFLNDVNLDSLAQIFHINKFYLTRKFKDTFGLTIMQYVIDKKISVAKELLRFSSSSITDISIQSGFHNITYFTKVFKAHEGITPSKFKTEWHDSFLE